ncbi:conserved hypothetical protein [Leishmania major strain Friedlin]|uniref:Enkurin domain-containing protein n=1 Tax=Leishmania major TaxID=5664 RepID=Q4QD16_LEIMA|nr:conserved hypothetical protein [Leishmania major strain Friedlin]CAG9573099.1 Enkuring_domain-containig_protein [Leishmania major strain Friedlin]CAJ03606.1 conserved hypothetical protein [Leishmania major strain Friedlin]|eukprot:XP_001682782.1 conserved hypothetical protein [Leishmania major strain Friedlin]
MKEVVSTAKRLEFKMSGESIFSLYAKSAAEQKLLSKSESPYTGVYDKHMAEPEKPSYSTFYEKGKEYDGTNVRFFKQREAVIGKNVGDSVDPQKYLRKGDGIRCIVPATHEEKVYRKPPVDNSTPFSQGGRSGDGESASAGVQYDADGNPISNGNGSLDAGRNGEDHSGVQGSANDGAAHGHGSGDYRADGRGGVAFSRDATKNFVASNIVEISNMVPKRRKMQAPLPTSRKSFGETPAYMSRVKREIAEEKAFVESLQEAKAQRQQQAHAKYIYLLPREEHDKLVQSMRRRNDECIYELQRMPFSKDTAGMRKRKTELEKTVEHIEVALKKLDRDALFIYKDDPVNGQWCKEAALKEAQKYAAHSH